MRRGRGRGRKNQTKKGIGKVAALEKQNKKEISHFAG
jgi:hypothetical protein